MKQRNEEELKVVEFLTDHLRSMKVVDKQIEVNDVFIDTFRGVLEGQAKKESFTAIDKNSQPVFCFGGWVIRPYVIDLWFLASVRLIRYPKACFQICWDYIEEVCFKKYGAKRVQTYVRCDWKVAEQFMFRLGFQIEGRLRLPDNDYYIFGRVK